MYKHAISLTCPNADTTVRDLATLQSSCPSVTPGVDGNYFSIASAERLGTAQAAQFQSGNQTGVNWHWAAILNESGELVGADSNCSNATAGMDTTYITSLGKCLEQNFRSQMPRTYQNSRVIFGEYYNWYAATSETGTFEQLSPLDAPDSVCPKGWKLPSRTESASIASKYSTTFKSSQASYVFSGDYGPGGVIDNVGNGLLQEARTIDTVSLNKAKNTFLVAWRNINNSSYQKAMGGTIRCIKEV